MKILLQYQSSSIVVELEDGRGINMIVEETFGIARQSYILKKYEPDFEEYVDLLDTATITNQDKLKIENLFMETERASASEFSAFLSESSGSVRDVVDYEVVLNLKNRRWPPKIIVPVDIFLKCLKTALNDMKDLSWELSKELIGHLANYCYQFSKYPTKLQRQQVCLVLVELYPHLKNDYGLGVGALEIKLMNKLKRLRQSDNSLEVSTIKRASQGSRMLKKVKRQEGKGALNWALGKISCLLLCNVLMI